MISLLFILKGDSSATPYHKGDNILFLVTFSYNEFFAILDIQEWNATANKLINLYIYIFIIYLYIAWKIMDDEMKHKILRWCSEERRNKIED